MTDTLPDTAPAFILLDELVDFQAHAIKAVQGGRRQVHILSEVLDEPLYSNDAFCEALHALVVQDRYCEARILVKDIKPIVEHGHRLLDLALRLSGKVQIRKLTVQPKNKDHAYLIVDTSALLYKHNDSVYKGYVDYDNTPKCKLLIEEFTGLWGMYGESDPSLRFQLL